MKRNQEFVRCGGCDTAINELERPQVEVRRVLTRKLGDYPYEAREIPTFASVYCSFRCAWTSLKELDEYRGLAGEGNGDA